MEAKRAQPKRKLKESEKDDVRIHDIERKNQSRGLSWQTLNPFRNKPKATPKADERPATVPTSTRPKDELPELTEERPSYFKRKKK